MKRSVIHSMVLVAALMLVGGPMLGCDGGDEENNSSNNGQTDTGSSDADASGEDTGGEDTGTEDTGTEDTGTADTGTEDTGTADTGTEDTGGEDTGTADVGQDVEEDTGQDAGGPTYCTGGPSCRGIEKLPANVPQVCNNTAGCNYDNPTQECQGIPEFTGCADLDTEQACLSFGCTVSSSGGDFACEQPATNPPIQCEWFETPDMRQGCILNGCAYNGPTEGECSAPSQDYMLDCSQFEVQSNTGCESTDPDCCAYWANSQRGNLCAPQNALGSPAEFCGAGPGMELNCTNVPVAECESREGCSLGNNNGIEYCQGRTPVICEDLTGEVPGQDGNFSRDCKAFGCDWQWTN